MPRIKVSGQAVQETRPQVQRRTLRAVPKSNMPIVKFADLRKVMFSATPPEQDLYRTRYGRALSLDRIDQALTYADNGNMRPLTDLSRETIDTDPHLAAVLGKRFGAISSLPWEVLPAQTESVPGEAADATMAKCRLYADVARVQLGQLDSFSQNINQLAWALFDGRAALENDWIFLPSVPGVVSPMTPYGAVQWQLGGMGWIHPRRLQFGPDRELRICDDYYVGQFQSTGIALRDMPYKFTEFKPQLFGDYPEREGLCRRCLYWSFFKRFGARERMVLMELYGKPWRWLEVEEDSSADKDDLESADTLLQNAGRDVSFRFPRGTKFQVTQPGKGAGEVHKDVIAESDAQLSKLVLGQTGTTDPQPSGMNNAQASVMQDEQYMILLRDAAMMSEVIETYITDAIVALNFGPNEVQYAPRFRLRSDLPLDRGAELDRLDKSIKLGLEIPLQQAYEVSGFTMPKATDAVVKMGTPAPHPLAVQAPPERVVVEYPAGTELPERVVQPVSDVAAGGMSFDEIIARQQAQTGAEPADDAVPVDGAPASPSTPAVSAPAGIGDFELGVATMETIVTVNEGRRQSGLGPLTLPGGAPDPDGNLTIEEFRAKRAAKGKAFGEAEGASAADDAGFDKPEPPSAPVVPPVKPALPNEQPAAAAATRVAVQLPMGPWPDFDACVQEQMGKGHDEASARAICGAIKQEVEGGMVIESAHPHDVGVLLAMLMTNDELEACTCESCRVQLASYPDDILKAKQPDTLYGSPETLVNRGVREGARLLGSLSDGVLNVAPEDADIATIGRSLDQYEEEMDLYPLTRAIERKVLQGLMLGALDSDYEVTENVVVKPVTFAVPPVDPNFASKPLGEAMSWFKQRNIVSKATFAKLSAAAQRRAFTVANMTSKQMIGAAKNALAKLVQDGGQLRDWKKVVADKFTSAGFVAANPSHVETIYRTNVLNAYNSGRYAHQTQPAVKKMRPCWQIRTVNDGPPRQRPTHQSVHLTVLAANDPFWQTAYPPFGYNCRCRVTTLSDGDVKERGLKVANGASISGLPDPGFTSGPGALL